MKKKAKINCIECDSEYVVSFILGSTCEELPIYCSFCGSELEQEDESEEEED